MHNYMAVGFEIDESYLSPALIMSILIVDYHGQPQFLNTKKFSDDYKSSSPKIFRYLSSIFKKNTPTYLAIYNKQVLSKQMARFCETIIPVLHSVYFGKNPPDQLFSPLFLELEDLNKFMISVRMYAWFPFWLTGNSSPLTIESAKLLVEPILLLSYPADRVTPFICLLFISLIRLHFLKTRLKNTVLSDEIVRKWLDKNTTINYNNEAKKALSSLLSVYNHDWGVLSRILNIDQNVLIKWYNRPDVIYFPISIYRIMDLYHKVVPRKNSGYL